jgi:replicative DNA helicase
MSKLPFFIDDTADLSIQDIRSKNKTIIFENKIGLIVIDYLQLMRVQSRKLRIGSKSYHKLLVL